MAGANLGFETVVYMGSKDVKRQQMNAYRMELMGTVVKPVETGSKTLKAATSEAFRDWVTNIGNTHYLIGSVVGPHPYPVIVRDFQSVIGIEAREQFVRTPPGWTHVADTPHRSISSSIRSASVKPRTPNFAAL